jgi:N-methylhydantoinase A
MTLFRLTARGLLDRPKLEAATLSKPDPSRARVGKRMVFVEAHNGMAEADVYDFERLVPGNVIEGPAVIHTPITTIVVQEDQRGTLDGYRNVLIDFH